MIQIARRGAGQRIGQCKSLGMLNLKGDRVIELIELRLDRLDDARMAMAGIAAPQARQAIEHAPSIGRGVVHALRSADQARMLFEMPVVGEGQPQGFEVWLAGDARSLSDLGNRREVVGERGQIGVHSRRIVVLFNEKARLYGPLSQRRSRFTLSPTGS